MSLDAAQRAQTARELSANAAACGLSRDQLIARSGLSPERYDAALAVEGADPGDVWILRDVLETAAREAGAAPTPYSVLTEDKRGAAGVWFGVTDRR